MGHRSCIVCHCPTTLPGAPSRTHAHRCLGRADKKRASSRRTLRSPTTYVIILEGRRPGGSIVCSALRSIVHLLLLLSRDSSIVRLFQPILIPHGFDDRVRKRPTAGPIDRSSWSTTTACVLEVRSGKSINEFAESSVRGQARATGIPNEYRTCKSRREFEARSRILEKPGRLLTSCTPVATRVERSFGSIPILSRRVGFPLESSIQKIVIVKSLQRKGSGISRLERIIELNKRFPIIARFIFAFQRLSDERTIIHVKHVARFLDKLSAPVNRFFQPVILEAIDFYETIHSSFSSSRKLLIHVATLFRAAVMTSGRRTTFR